MRNIALIILLLASTNCVALQYWTCNDPPMKAEDFDALLLAIRSEIGEAADNGIEKTGRCDGKEKKIAQITYEPHIINGDYKESYYIDCYREPPIKSWSCNQPRTRKSLINGKEIVSLWGDISTEEAREIITFIEGINTNSFSALKNQDEAPSKEELVNYRKTLSISKNPSHYIVYVPGGKLGNAFKIKRIECGLSKCDLEVTEIQWIIS